MLIDLEAADTDQSISCWACIVGGGAVGLAMAVRLARAGRDVVLLEGGGASLEARSQDLHRGTSIGHPFQNIHVGRYRVLGGTTTFWAGQVLPIDHQAILPRPWLASEGWPISPDDLAPFHNEAYRLLGLGGVERDDDAVWRKMGVSSFRDPNIDLILTRWLPQRNFSRLFRADIDANQNLRAVVHANVTGVTMDESRQRVMTIQARSLTGRRIAVTPKVSVLACGSLETARLLLHPSADGEALPWHSNAWLGRGFTDHLHGDVAEVDVLDRKAFHKLFDSIYLDGHRYYPRLRLSPAAQRAERTLDVSGEFLFDSEFTQHIDNIKIFLRALEDGRLPDNVSKLPGHVASVARIAAPLLWRYLTERRAYKPRNAKVRLAVSAEQFPVADSHIRLGQELDAVGSRRIVVDWRIKHQEVHSLKIFAQSVAKAMEARGLARLRIDSDLEVESAAFLDKIADGIHQTGTARMGTDPAKGVVDRNLRVFGTDNLYAAGQSTVPLAGFANPTFTGVALGLRLCDHLSSTS